MSSSEPRTPHTAGGTPGAAPMSWQAPSRRAVLAGGFALGSLGLLSACGTEKALQFDPDQTPRRGGILKVGLTGGSTADTVDPHAPVNTTDGARVINLYEPLVKFNDDYEIIYRLAESLQPNEDATVWTVVLREGVKFSNGAPVTAEDVQATIERIVNPDDPKNMASGLAMYQESVIVDDRTLEVRLSSPNAILDDTMSQYSFGIVPKNFDLEHPIGAGPFTLGAFTPGQSTILKRNELYWDIENGPFLDEVHLLNFDETDAAINALLSTQVDCVGQIPSSLVEVIRSDPRLEVLNSETGRWLPLTMRVDAPPFDDVRVRQAFRLAVDRDQMIQQVLSGYGSLGYDMFAPFDPGTPNLKREQNLDEAKRLLTEAGYPDGLTVTLNTAPIQSGVVESAQVFAQQAKEAGITVNINRMDTTTFFGDQYLSWDFAQSFWNTRNFISQARDCATEAAPFNETHWTDPQFLADLNAAQAETDPQLRYELIGHLQKRLFEEGGYIIWGFPNQLDAYQRYVLGLKENKLGLPLSGYTFRRVWLAEVK